MKVIDKDYGRFDVYLADDGTMDTVIEVCHKDDSKEIRFDGEYASYARRPNGSFYDCRFKELAQDAAEAYIEQYLI